MIPRVVPFLMVAVALAGPLVAQAPRAVSVGRPVTDSLTAHDPVRRSVRTPYHVWRFEGRRGQRLVVDLESEDFDSYLVVRDPDGYTVGSDDDSGDELNARLRVILARDGMYRVIATAVGDSARGRYTLTVSGWETPSVPPAGAAAALAIGDTKDGLLEPGDDLSPDGPYQDRWTFSARQGARLRIELRSPDFDSYLAVLGPDGAVVGTDDDGLGERNSLVAVRARAAGQYTILATSFGEDLRVGAYRVTVLEETGVFADPGAPAAIQAGETKEGRLESGDAVGERGIQDRWTFQGRAGQVVRLDAVSSDFDPYLVLSFTETVVDSNDDGGDGNSARILAVLPGTGTYLAAVSAFTQGGAGGRYTLALTGSTALAEAGRIGRIAFGQRLAGRLERGDEAREDNGYQDRWEFDARPDQDVTVELRSGAFDTYVELRDPQGNVVAENDDGLGDGTDSFVAAHLTRGGRYRIVVRGYGDRESTGLYELALGQASAAARPGQEIELRLGETTMGRLEPGDSVMGDRSFADVFVFRPTVSGRVVIQVRSSDFDAFLILQDAEGRTLASDDDGGTGTDAQLTYEVVAGRAYRILANSYGEERRTGAYRVIVRPAS
jgi:hypothetical protein